MILAILAAALVASLGSKADTVVGQLETTSVTIGVASLMLGAPPCGTPEATKEEKCLHWVVIDCEAEQRSRDRFKQGLLPAVRRSVADAWEIPGCEYLWRGR